MGMFYYPSFDDAGVKVLSRAGDRDNDMMMDVDVYRMQKGDTRTFRDDAQETAVMLVIGDITYIVICKQFLDTRSEILSLRDLHLHERIHTFMSGLLGYLITVLILFHEG